DGIHGLRVVQLTSPATPGNYGFSPRPTPELVATYPMKGRALAISKGLDRDRAVDESGNQIAVFGRVGAGPLTLEQQRRLYLYNGEVWKVSNDPADFGSSLPASRRTPSTAKADANSSRGRQSNHRQGPTQE